MGVKVIVPRETGIDVVVPGETGIDVVVDRVVVVKTKAHDARGVAVEDGDAGAPDVAVGVVPGDYTDPVAEGVGLAAHGGEVPLLPTVKTGLPRGAGPVQVALISAMTSAAIP